MSWLVHHQRVREGRAARSIPPPVLRPRIAGGLRSTRPIQDTVEGLSQPGQTLGESDGTVVIDIVPWDGLWRLAGVTDKHF